MNLDALVHMRISAGLHSWHFTKPWNSGNGKTVNELHNNKLLSRERIVFTSLSQNSFWLGFGELWWIWGLFKMDLKKYSHYVECATSDCVECLWDLPGWLWQVWGPCLRLRTSLRSLLWELRRPTLSSGTGSYCERNNKFSFRSLVSAV